MERIEGVFFYWSIFAWKIFEKYLQVFWILGIHFFLGGKLFMERVFKFVFGNVKLFN